MRSDNPIRHERDDLLARLPLAVTFAEQIRSVDFSDGLVVAVVGPWGSGKTSFINFVEGELRPHVKAVIEFNPWLFSGAGQLVDAFFAEVGTQLRARRDLNGLSEALIQYGEALSGLGWVPVVGTWVDRFRLVMKSIGKALRRRPVGVDGQRKWLAGEMRGLDQPLVVVLDDIDRLTKDEIREVFRLVRVTAAFPNLIFILAYDRSRVERALDDSGLPGREYLEKFVQVVEDLPRMPDLVLTNELTASLNRTLDGLSIVPRLDATRWPDILLEIIRPLVRNIRDVRRYCLSIPTTLKSIGDAIDLGDVLALEAIRIFRPDLFDQIRRSSAVLTTLATGSFGHSSGPDADLANAVLEAADSTGYGRDLIDRLFPAASHYVGGNNYTADFQKLWLRERLVAHPHLLAFYLDRIQGAGLQAFTSAEGARLLLAAPDDLSDYLLALTPEARLATIEQLEAFEGDFEIEATVPGASALLNLIPTLPKEDHGFLSIGPDLIVGRVVIRMLASATEIADREALADQIYGRLETLSTKADFLVLLAPSDDGNYSGLVRQEWYDEAVARYRSEFTEASGEQLAAERDLMRVYLLANRYLAATQPPFVALDNPVVTAALVASSRSEVRAQGLGSRYVRVSGRLAWESLAPLLGGERAAADRISDAETEIRAISPELWELAQRYAQGNPPGRHD